MNTLWCHIYVNKWQEQRGAKTYAYPRLILR